MDKKIEDLQEQFQRLKELKDIVESLKQNRNENDYTDIFPATAIIIEPRKHMALSFVIRNILENLNLNWSVVIYHGNLNKDYVEKILETDISEFRERITLKNLEIDNLPNSMAYSQIHLNKKFIEEIPTETFLVFQTDSMINPKYKDLIRNFMMYDYVGAPWADHIVGNGGFSLRKRSKMLEILNSCPIASILAHEDVLFSYGSKTVKPWKPTFEEAKEFSVERIYSEKFFGIHKAWYYLKERIGDLCSNCPGLETLISLQKLYDS